MHPERGYNLLFESNAILGNNETLNLRKSTTRSFESNAILGNNET